MRLTKIRTRSIQKRPRWPKNQVRWPSILDHIALHLALDKSQHFLASFQFRNHQTYTPPLYDLLVLRKLIKGVEIIVELLEPRLPWIDWPRCRWRYLYAIALGLVVTEFTQEPRNLDSRSPTFLCGGHLVRITINAHIVFLELRKQRVSYWHDDWFGKTYSSFCIFTSLFVQIFIPIFLEMVRLLIPSNRM